MGREEKARKARQKLRSEGDAGRSPGEAAERGDAAYAQAEGELVAHAGPHWEAAGDGNALRIDNALVRRTLRWNADATAGDFEGKDPQALTAKEIALLVTRRNMLSPEAKHSNAAVRNLVAMEAQNQRDDLGEIEPPVDRSDDIRRDLEAIRRLAGELNAHESIIDAAYRVEPAAKALAQPGTNGHASQRRPVDGGPPPPVP